MKNLQILYSDIYTERNNFVELLSSEFVQSTIDLSDILRTEYKNDSDLGKQIKSCIDNGVIIPTELINSILKKLIKSSDKDILLLNYPITKEHYQDLLELKKSLGLKISKIWHLNLTNLEYVSRKELTKMDKAYVEKFEITSNDVVEKITKKKLEISKALGNWSENSKIITIDVDFERQLNLNDYLIDKIKSA